MSKSKYKILVIQHLLKNNEIAKSGDIVEGSKFVNLQESLDGGFCEFYEDDENIEETPLQKEINSLKSMKKKELVGYAKENDYEIDGTANKADILSELIEKVTAKFEESE